jgi:hypothetical protein
MITKELIEDAKAAGWHESGLDGLTEQEVKIFYDWLVKFAELQRQRERSLLAPEGNEKRQAVPDDYEEMRRDANRYRWLRRDVLLMPGNPFIARMTALGAVSRWTGTHADEAIDADILDCPHPIVEENKP